MINIIINKVPLDMFGFHEYTKDLLSNYEQQDSAEFLRFLLDYIEYREFYVIDKVYVNIENRCTNCSNYGFISYGGATPTLTIEIEGGSVQACINKYFQDEDVVDDYICTREQAIKWDFPIDKATETGLPPALGCGLGLTKKYIIKSLPEVLIISLKRFVTVGIDEADNTISEKQRELIDITPEIDLKGNTDYKYNLQAVVYHHGQSLSSGHYTATCLVDGSWINYDDNITSVVNGRPIDEENKHCYILFYTLVGAQVSEVGLAAELQPPAPAAPAAQIDPPPYLQSEEDIARYHRVLDYLHSQTPEIPFAEEPVSREFMITKCVIMVGSNKRENLGAGVINISSNKIEIKPDSGEQKNYNNYIITENKKNSRNDTGYIITIEVNGENIIISLTLTPDNLGSFITYIEQLKK